jgi:hypothetical protein
MYGSEKPPTSLPLAGMVVLIKPPSGLVDRMAGIGYFLSLNRTLGAKRLD